MAEQDNKSNATQHPDPSEKVFRKPSVFDSQEFSPYTDNAPIVSSSEIDQMMTKTSAFHSNISQTFEDLTLAEVTNQFIHHPRQTWRSLWSILYDTDASTPQVIIRQPKSPFTTNEFRLADLEENTKVDHLLKLIGYLVAFALVWFGNHQMINAQSRSEALGLVVGAPWVIAGFFIWLSAELYGNYQQLLQWWREKNQPGYIRVSLRAIALLCFIYGVAIMIQSFGEIQEDIRSLSSIAFRWISVAVFLWFLIDIFAWIFSALYKRNPTQFPNWLQTQFDAKSNSEAHEPYYPNTSNWRDISLIRLFALFTAIPLTIITWLGTTGNIITDSALLAWFGSILFWSLALSDTFQNPLKIFTNRLSDWKPAIHQYWWVILALLVIVGIGAQFRLQDLDGVPPEMTSDHVEKLLDSQRVLNGTHQIFFANNGGREPFQMYAMALFSQLPGLNMNFYTLKLLAVVESLITLPILFWMGVEVMGKQSRRLGILVGLLMAALVAVSYWHVSITRLSLRIVLTPMVTALLVVFLSRAIRNNRRSDFIKAGLTLGFGLYMYQAVRMLPVVITVAVISAFFYQAKSWQVRKNLVLNFLTLVFISFIIFIPLFHYSIESPEHFWLRTSGRLLGDGVIIETSPDGRLKERDATFTERIEAFNGNIPILSNNIRNVLLMFNWKGDVAWINGAPNHPAMDTFTGALLVIGLAAWVVRGIQKKDLVVWLIPIALFIMLLPSALAIAYPVENPSATRTSGALPFAYLMAAFPLVLIIRQFFRLLPQPIAAGISILAVSGILFGAYQANSDVYFNDYRISYEISSLPHSDGGQVLRNFVATDGAYNNAFMIAYPYWWDHRIVGMEADLIDWQNGIVSRDDIPQFLNNAYLRNNEHQFDPDYPLLFLYHRDDLETSILLQEWFPNGFETLFESYQQGQDFLVYRVPILGEEAFLEWLDIYYDGANF